MSYPQDCIKCRQIPSNCKCKNTHLIFVYGTLMNGERNHHCIGAGQYVKEATTVPQYSLHDLGAFPALGKGETAVKGEIFEVSEKDLVRMDHLEGHPTFYRREPIKVFGFEEEYIEAYFLPQASKYPEIKSGDWRNK